MYSVGPDLLEIVNTLLNDTIPGIKQVKGIINFGKRMLRWGFKDRHIQKINEFNRLAEEKSEEIYQLAKESAQGDDRVIDEDFSKKFPSISFK